MPVTGSAVKSISAHRSTDALHTASLAVTAKSACRILSASAFGLAASSSRAVVLGIAEGVSCGRDRSAPQRRSACSSGTSTCHRRSSPQRIRNRRCLDRRVLLCAASISACVGSLAGNRRQGQSQAPSEASDNSVHLIHPGDPRGPSRRSEPALCRHPRPSLGGVDHATWYIDVSASLTSTAAAIAASSAAMAISARVASSAAWVDQVGRVDQRRRPSPASASLHFDLAPLSRTSPVGC